MSLSDIAFVARPQAQGWSLFHVLRFTPYVSRFLEAGRARCRWSRIVRRN